MGAAVCGVGMDLDDVDAALDSLIRPAPIAGEAAPQNEQVAEPTAAEAPQGSDWPGRQDVGDLFSTNWASDEPLPLRGSFDEKIAYFRARLKRAEVQLERQRTAWEARQSELDLLEGLWRRSLSEIAAQRQAQAQTSARLADDNARWDAHQAQERGERAALLAEAQRLEASHRDELARNHRQAEAQQAQVQDSLSRSEAAGAALQSQNEQLQQEVATLRQRQAQAQRTHAEAHSSLQGSLAEAEQRLQQHLLQMEDRQAAHAAELALRDQALAELKARLGTHQQGAQELGAQLQAQQAELQRQSERHQQAEQALREELQQLREQQQAAAERSAAEQQAQQAQAAEAQALLEQEQNGHRRAILELQERGAQRMVAEQALVEAAEAASRQRQQAQAQQEEMQEALTMRETTLVELKAQQAQTQLRLDRLSAELRQQQQIVAAAQQQQGQERQRRQEVLGRSRRALQMAQELLGQGA